MDLIAQIHVYYLFCLKLVKLLRDQFYWRFGLVLGLFLLQCLEPVLAQAPGFTPTSAYKREVIQGFTVLIHPGVLRYPREAQELRREMQTQLGAIARAVPSQPLAALKRVRIWVEWQQRVSGAAEFHPSAVWLRQNGYNPDKAGAVEVSNVRHFLQWSRGEQPWMLCHELAHAYHHRVLGVSYPGIEQAYQQALKRRLYESVQYVRGGRQRAYALTNAKEYFAELSESYLGKNDFYPFTRSQLQRYDPIGYQLMEKVWGKVR